MSVPAKAPCTDQPPSPDTPRESARPAVDGSAVPLVLQVRRIGAEDYTPDIIQITNNPLEDATESPLENATENPR